MIRDGDVSLDALRGSVIGVIGYGNQGRAQALNVRDSGFEVRVGLRSRSRSREVATSDGFHPDDPDRVVAAADLVMMLTPDEGLPAVAADLGPRVRPGGAMGFAHGAALAFGGITFPPEIDVVLVAPAGPGVDVRERFESKFKI